MPTAKSRSGRARELADPERSREKGGRTDKALELLGNGEMRAEDMITHRFHFEDAPEAFDLLYNNLGETMGVLLVWQD